MHKIDVSRGSKDSTVSRQWADRPADQRFLSLAALLAQVTAWRSESRTQDVKPGDIRAVHDHENPLFLGFDVAGVMVDATHYSFGQVASMAGAPSDYLRRLPGPLAALNLNYG